MGKKMKKMTEKEKDGLIENLRKDRDAYKRDSKAYLAMLEKHGICPDCGTVNDTCDCPFG
jgi:hypothetical protein